MKQVKIQQLSRENFHKFGSYAMLIDPLDSPATGPKYAPIAFFRDMLQQDLGGVVPSFSTCRMQYRPMIVTDAEYHDYTSEVSMPLDQDCVVWCAPAGAGKECPVDEIEAFFVPKGCMLMLRPGVWHHAAYAVENKPLNVMIVLPERAYATDCYCVSLDADKQVELVF